MLESYLILLTIIGFILMILSFKWESLAFCSITFVIWMGLAIAIHQIEIPYQAIQNDNTIVTGTQTVNNLFMYSLFYIGLAVIMFLYMITLVFFMFKDRDKKIM